MTTPSNATVVVDLPSLDVVACLLVDLLGGPPTHKLISLNNLTACSPDTSKGAARGHLDDRIKAHGVGIHAERRATLSLSTPSVDGPCGSGDASRATQRHLSREDRGYRARGSQVHKRQPLDHGPMCRRTRLQLDAHQLASREDRPGRGSQCFVRA